MTPKIINIPWATVIFSTCDEKVDSFAEKSEFYENSDCLVKIGKFLKFQNVFLFFHATLSESVLNRGLQHPFWPGRRQSGKRAKRVKFSVISHLSLEFQKFNGSS